jgi:hypothetical protein
MGSTKLGSGSLLYAGAFNTNNGPWTNPDNVRLFTGLARYSQGTATDGVSATATAYANNWNSADQVALRAITTGQIGILGQQDPTDGGDTSRFSLSTRMAQSDNDGLWKANAYFVSYSLNLFNNYEWFTTPEVPTPISAANTGDQFRQHENRIYTGGGTSRTINSTLFDLPTETLFGVQTRYDDISDSLSHTFQRQLLFNNLIDRVKEGNVGIYAQNTMHWTDWFKTTAGWRGDAFAASVDSTLQPANSGRDEMMIGSPKFTAVLGPFYKTELFAGAGMGYHSNDARSTVITQIPADPTTPQGASPLLVRSRGGEVGIRTKAVPNLDSSVSFFYLRQNSELFFDGDTGDTTAGLPSQRTGVEFTNDYRLKSWLHIDRRSGALARPVPRFRQWSGGALPIPCWVSADPDRQRAGQLRLQCAVDGGLGGHHAGRKDRLVQCAALALHQLTTAHRGRCVSIAAIQHHQRLGGLPVRQRLACRARRPQFAELDDRSGHLRLWFGAQ